MDDNVDIAGSAMDIVEAGRLMIGSGLVAGTWGNISCRCQTGRCLITPSGIPFNTLQPGDLVAVDLESGACNGRLRPSTETPMHAAIYRARPDVGAIVHTHSLFASVLAVTRMELPPVLEEMAQLLGGSVPVARHALSGSRELAEAAVEALEQRSAVLLANHGLVGVGRTVQEALTVCQLVERSAQIWLWSKMTGTPHLLEEQEVLQLRQRFLKHYGQEG